MIFVLGGRFKHGLDPVQLLQFSAEKFVESALTTLQCLNIILLTFNLLTYLLLHCLNSALHRALQLIYLLLQIIFLHLVGLSGHNHEQVNVGGIFLRVPSQLFQVDGLLTDQLKFGPRRRNLLLLTHIAVSVTHNCDEHVEHCNLDEEGGKEEDCLADAGQRSILIRVKLVLSNRLQVLLHGLANHAANKAAVIVCWPRHRVDVQINDHHGGSEDENCGAEQNHECPDVH